MVSYPWMLVIVGLPSTCLAFLDNTRQHKEHLTVSKISQTRQKMAGAAAADPAGSFLGHSDIFFHSTQKAGRKLLG